MEYNYLILACIIVTAMAQLYPSRVIPNSWFNDDYNSDQSGEASARQDQEESPTNEHHHGRVQIKVYRGPDSHDEHEHFAPYGYWVKQPADAESHHR